jgi:hypothetical protein
MTAGKDARITSVRITGRQLDRLTATESIGGVVCRITLEQGDDGRYREIDCRPLQPGDVGNPRR